MCDTHKSVGAIKHARQTKHFLPITTAEMVYVSSCKDLNETEKLLWFNFADMTKLDPTLSVTATHRQLAERLGKSQYSISRRIRNLHQKGFLSVEYDELGQHLIYTLRLPEEGIKQIELAPNRMTRKSYDAKEGAEAAISQSDHLPPCTDAHPPMHSCNPTLNIYNRINKKHNMHDMGQSLSESNLKVVPSTPPDENDPYVLLNAYEASSEKLRQDNPKISIRELTNKMNEKFTSEQMELIFEAQRSRAEKEDQKRCMAAPAQPRASQKSTADQAKAAQRIEACADLEPFRFEGQTYKLEKKTLEKLTAKIPWFNKTKDFKGEASTRDRKDLLKEVLYYISCATKSDYSQLHRLNSALFMMRKGDWQVPHALLNQQIKQRESNWQYQKDLEIKRSKQSFECLGHAH